MCFKGEGNPRAGGHSAPVLGGIDHGDPALLRGNIGVVPVPAAGDGGFRALDIRGVVFGEEDEGRGLPHRRERDAEGAAAAHGFRRLLDAQDAVLLCGRGAGERGEQQEQKNDGAGEPLHGRPPRRYTAGVLSRLA